MATNVIAQRNAHEYIRQGRPFKASALTAKWVLPEEITWGRMPRSEVNGIRNVIEGPAYINHVAYVVYSYGTPMLVQTATGSVIYQYINTGYYSNTTSKHQRIIREGLR